MIKDTIIQTFLSDFQQAFFHLKDKKIALYGIGKNAALLVENLPDYNFIGLMDKNPENIGTALPFGKGIKILNDEEALKKADAVIITSSELYWKIIFERIRFSCEKYCVPVYYLNGQIAASENQVESDDLCCNYTLKDLYEAIDKYQVISFDIFDTLLMRKVILPEDVFSLVALFLKQKGMKCNFFSCRKNAFERANAKKGLFTNLDDIYDELQLLLNLTADETRWIKNLEIDMEKRILVPRKDMLEAFYYAIRQGKKVNLVTDMYWTPDIIKHLLADFSISGYSELWVSSQLGIAKSDKSLWGKYSILNENMTCLHIGDDFIADIENAQIYGIDTFQILSSYRMLEKSSFRQLIPKILTFSDSLNIGVLIAEIFNSPFALKDKRGRIVIDSLFLLGYVVFGSLVFNYLMWIVQENCRLEQRKVLFFARDGYVLRKLYDDLIDILHIKYAPEAIYFKISRRMVMIASICDEASFQEVVQHEYQGSFGHFLKSRFGIVGRSEDENLNLIVNSEIDYEKILKWIAPYKKEILANAEIERQNYLQYIKKLNIFGTEKVSIVDLFFSGTSQHYLSKLMNRSFLGFYCCALLGSENKYGLGNFMKSLYQREDDPKAVESNIRKYSQLLESVLTAPEGMYFKCEGNGVFKNSEKRLNQLNFSKKEKIHNGIKAYMDEILKVYQGLNDRIIPYSDLLVDDLFGKVFSGHCIIDSHILQTFSHDDELFGFTERKIWD